MSVIAIETATSMTMSRGELMQSGFSRVDVPDSRDNPIRNHLAKEVYGQDDAVEAVSSAIMRSEAGFNDPNRPKGIFLFLGPTGVGKTELAKGVARFLYGSEWKEHFKRVDCTDFVDEVAVNRIKGSEPSYVGYGDPVEIMPDFLAKGAVIAFDEIEKANRSLHRWLLPVMEEGSATVPLPTNKEAASGHKGKEIVPTKLDFTQSYIVMTSNVGADAIEKAKKGDGPIGFTGSVDTKNGDIKSAAFKALKSHFVTMPEFLGRIGESNTVVFKDLGIEEYNMIFDKFMRELCANQSQAGIILSATQELRDWMIQESLQGSYGARTLRDLIENMITSNAARLRFAKKIGGGLLIADRDEESGAIHFWSQLQQEIPRSVADTTSPIISLPAAVALAQ